MAKLRSLSGKEVIRLLSINGYSQIRKRGSHVVMQKTDSESTVTVIVPDHKEIKIGTLSSIIRQSRLSRDLFEG